MSGTRPAILYAEDDENDVFFVTRAFAKAGGPRLEVVATGRDAVALLTRHREVAASRPALVLLDLNLPFLSGHEVLAWIRQEPAFANLPVVVFTSSAQPSDIEGAYLAGATAYLTKPNAPSRMIEVATLLHQVIAAPHDARALLSACPTFHPPPADL